RAGDDADDHAVEDRGRTLDDVDVSEGHWVVRPWADGGDHGCSKRVSRAEPYRRDVRIGSGSAGSVRAPVSTTSSPSGARTRSRCFASFGSSSAHDSYGASTRTRSYFRVSCLSVQIASAQTTRAPVSFSFSRFCEIVRHAALSLSTNVALAAPRDSASIPSAPEPAKRSSTVAFSTGPIRL